MHHLNPPATDYGIFHIAKATPISVPTVTPDDPMVIEYFGEPPGEDPMPGKRERLDDGYGTGREKRMRLEDPGGDPNPDPNPDPPDDPAQPPPPPPPPLIDFVGVMDVGQGNCNVLVKGGHPQAYFDVGFPPNRFVPSAPQDISAKPPPPPPCGPITQNEAGNLFVVLSHWDWDHYQLGRQWPALKQLSWYFPAQAKGPAATEFYGELPVANRHAVPVNAPTFFLPEAPAAHLFTVYSCDPGPLPRSSIMNNSGLAITTLARLPALGVTNRVVLLTADASMQSLPATAAPALARVGAMTAVHHGSKANRAADDLPNPAVLAEGRIVYSYGILPAGEHTYHFPAPEAWQKYDEAGWTSELSTAQGNAISDGTHLNPYPPPLPRGNVRIGAGAFNALYANTAFALFAHSLE